VTDFDSMLFRRFWQCEYAQTKPAALHTPESDQHRKPCNRSTPQRKDELQRHEF
jgi:hypothetical protein